jgi:hypothetical protein
VPSFHAPRGAPREPGRFQPHDEHPRALREAHPHGRRNPAQVKQQVAFIARSSRSRACFIAARGRPAGLHPPAEKGPNGLPLFRFAFRGEVFPIPLRPTQGMGRPTEVGRGLPSLEAGGPNLSFRVQDGLVVPRLPSFPIASPHFVRLVRPSLQPPRRDAEPRAHVREPLLRPRKWGPCPRGAIPAFVKTARGNGSARHGAPSPTRNPGPRGSIRRGPRAAGAPHSLKWGGGNRRFP